MQDSKDDLSGTRNNNKIPKFVEEKGIRLRLGVILVLLGKMIVYYPIGSNDSLMKTKLLVTPLEHTH